jgi:hypothetical protein
MVPQGPIPVDSVDDMDEVDRWHALSGRRIRRGAESKTVKLFGTMP